MQSYGGPWTLLKLGILEKYLEFYTKALKNTPFKLCYIDAFAGSGSVTIKGIGEVPGSALRALDYPFDKYIFIEKDKHYADRLEKVILEKTEKKEFEIRVGDCNKELETVLSFPRSKSFWRGVIFLDPYAMNFYWNSLRTIQKTEIFDVWYLFPISALCRVMQRDGQIPPKNKEIINKLLGTIEWEKEIYYQSPQLSLFEDSETERVTIEGIGDYVVKRLRTIFPAVSKRSLTLRNPLNNSPLFLLCFAVSNPSQRAVNLSLRAADYILTHIS